MSTRQRIAVLDVLRGLAIIGTLGTNIWIFTDPIGPANFLAALPDPTSFAGQVEAILRSLANGKFLALLTVLFGVGLELQYQSAKRRNVPRRQAGPRLPGETARAEGASGGAGVVPRRQAGPGWYLWRAVLLFIEGLLHYVLVFEFDVLMAYAVTSMIVAYLIGRSDRAIRAWMLVVGAIHVAFVSLLTAGMVYVEANGGSYGTGDSGATSYAQLGYLEQVTGRLTNITTYRAEIVFIVPSGIVLFLFGARLLRNGAFGDTPTGARIRRRLMVAGLGVAAPLNLLTTLSGPQWFLLERYLLAPLIALGALALVVTLVHRMRGAPGPIRHGLSCVGRTALSCYVFQNVLASVLCYGWGFGLAERFADARPWWVVAAWAGISVTFMLLATWWLRRFDRGPLESVWQWAYTAPQRQRDRRTLTDDETATTAGRR